MLCLKTERTKKAKAPVCIACGEATTNGRYVTGVGYICNQCYGQKSYDFSDFSEKGKPGKLASFGFEVEVDPCLSKHYTLLKHGFVPTYDGSVEMEFKSPIYYSKSGLQIVLDTMSIFASDIVSTHIHFECVDKDLAISNWKPIWIPIANYLYEREDLTRKIFGRFFSSRWCSKYVTIDERYTAFNIATKYDTWELRLPRFRSPDQFSKLIDWGRRVSQRLTLTDPDKARMGIIRDFNKIFGTEVPIDLH